MNINIDVNTLLIGIILIIILMMRGRSEKFTNEEESGLPVGEPTDEQRITACGDSSTTELWKHNVNSDMCIDPTNANEKLTTWFGNYTRVISCTDDGKLGICRAKIDKEPIRIDRKIRHFDWVGTPTIMMYNLSDDDMELISPGRSSNPFKLVDTMNKKWYHIGKSTYEIKSISSYGSFAGDTMISFTVEKIVGNDIPDDADLEQDHIDLYGSPASLFNTNNMARDIR